jgi:glycosyltransferase involved in cell wall biosynthesis
MEFLKKYRHFGIDSILKVLNIEVTSGTILDSFIYLLKYGKKIDILQVYHFTIESLIVSFIFRIFNKNGKTYLKLDMKPDIINQDKQNLPVSSIKSTLYRKLLKFISYDVISVETKALNKFLKTEHPIFRHFHENIYYIPSGIILDQNVEDDRDIFDKKENIILHIGRLSFDKGTDIALEAFIGSVDQLPEWKLVLIGNMDNSFENYFSQIIRRYPDEAKKIERVRFIKSAKELKKWYQKGKILLVPSHSESFGIATIEAGINGCVVVGSNIVSFYEITNNGSYGYLCPVDDLDCFKKTLKNVLLNKAALKRRSLNFKAYILINYNWSEICKELHNILNVKNIRFLR